MVTVNEKPKLVSLDSIPPIRGRGRQGMFKEACVMACKNPGKAVLYRSDLRGHQGGYKALAQVNGCRTASRRNADGRTFSLFIIALDEK
jgi:hypothetical protein